MTKRTKELSKLTAKADKAIDTELFNVYKEALKKLKKEAKVYSDLLEDLSVSERIAYMRNIKTANAIENIIRELSKETQEGITGFIKESAINSYLGVFYDLEDRVKFALDFDMLNERYVEALVNKKIAGKTFSQRLYKDSDKLAMTVKQELVNGAMNGKGYAKIAKAISESTEASYKQSLRIARTEGHRVQSESTQRAYEEAEDLGIELQKQWMASLDDTTRDEHAELDGQTVGIDEEFEINGYTAMGPGMFGDAALDINCRCTTITIVNGISPKLRKDNETKEVVEYKNYSEWKSSRGY